MIAAAFYFTLMMMTLMMMNLMAGDITYKVLVCNKIFFYLFLYRNSCFVHSFLLPALEKKNKKTKPTRIIKRERLECIEWKFKLVFFFLQQQLIPGSLSDDGSIFILIYIYIRQWRMKKRGAPFKMWVIPKINFGFLAFQIHR